MSVKVHGVFEAQNPAELGARYDEWASSYEEEMGDHSGQREAVEVVARYAAPGARILDAGCGTGLPGQMLAERGFRNLEGLDISAGMLREASKKGCYRALHQGVLGEPLSFADAAFDIVLC